MSRYKHHRYDRDQIVTFLHALDQHLTEPHEIFVIGGIAAILGYHAVAPTADLDVFTIDLGSHAGLARAMRLAGTETGIDLTLDRATIAELPYNHEERRRLVRDVKFKNLLIRVPDKYDLVLSKAIRAYGHDLDAIQSIHANHPLSEKTLAKRFEDEIWKLAMGNPRNHALNMVIVMQVLYGDDRAKHYKRRWLDTKP